MATVKVRYIGQKLIKRDTICNTLTIWTQEDNVQDVESDVAVKLFQYPDVWVPADKPVVKRPEAPKAPDPKTAEELAAEEAAAAALAAAGGNVPLTGPVTAEEIVTILPALDKEADFSEKGMPKVNSVRAHFPDREVTVAVLKAAWETFTAKPE